MEIVISTKAKKQIKALKQPYFDQAKAIVDALKEEKSHLEIKKLKTEKPWIYSAKKSKIRVLFQKSEDTIYIVAIGLRKDVYVYLSRRK